MNNKKIEDIVYKNMLTTSHNKEEQSLDTEILDKIITSMIEHSEKPEIIIYPTIMTESVLPLCIEKIPDNSELILHKKRKKKRKK